MINKYSPDVSAYKVQELVDCYNSPGAKYFRVMKGSTWESWQRIDNYGTSSLSELASALGVKVDGVPYNNFNSLEEVSNGNPIVYYCNGISMSNGPYSSSYPYDGFVFSPSKSSVGSSVQFYIDCGGNPGASFIRAKRSSTGWSEWKSIAFTA